MVALDFKVFSLRVTNHCHFDSSEIVPEFGSKLYLPVRLRFRSSGDFEVTYFLPLLQRSLSLRVVIAYQVSSMVQIIDILNQQYIIYIYIYIYIYNSLYSMNYIYIYICSHPHKTKERFICLCIGLDYLLSTLFDLVYQ